MPVFSKASQAELQTADEQLVRLFNTVIKFFDCTVIDGSRTVDEQRKNVARKVSKTMDSKHIPACDSCKARAVDVAPYPIDWNDVKRHYYFAGFVKGVAAMLGIPIRWGGDWDSDTEVADQTFNDLVHFELKAP